MVLDNIDCTFTNGEQVAIIGRSGCGKSTLLHLVAGLARPTSGVVRIDGKPVIKPCARWNMMFQKASLFPWLTACENAALGLRYAGHKRNAAHKRAFELLELLGLADKANVNVQQLSGGQQQRVALARSLATDPDILLLDEPFSALDTFARTSLQQEVSGICKDNDINLIIVTHDVDEALIMADRVLVMAQGPGRIANEYIVNAATGNAKNQADIAAARQELMALFQQESPSLGSQEQQAQTPANLDTAA